MSSIYSHITLIGCGLIGSSMARAIRHHRLCGHLTVVEKTDTVANEVRELQLADTVTTNIAEGVKEADLVVICTPVCTYDGIARAMADHLKPGATVSDVGSVKQLVGDIFGDLLPNTVYIVPAHPIAGTENSGPSAGFAHLFHNRWCIVTPIPRTDETATNTLIKFWQALGANVDTMPAKHHDHVLSITSHLPHLIAYTIVGTADDLADDLKEEVIKYSASGFRDFTRIAASDPTMWRDIFLNNKTAVLDILQRFNEDLTELQRAIRRDDGDTLFNHFTRTRAIRRAVVDYGQDVPEAYKEDKIKVS